MQIDIDLHVSFDFVEKYTCETCDLKYTMTQIILNSIGVIRTPFKQKFAIPRQPNLVNAPGTVYFSSEFDDEQCVKGLEHYSHLWLVFYFSATAAQGWKKTVKAPRLGGNKTLGVFASRSTFRPNPLGLSVVKNLGYRFLKGQLVLDVEGVDLLDETPILDIKPYLPYADALADSHASMASGNALEAPQNYPVTFSPDAKQTLATVASVYPDLANLIEKILAQDPRPAYRQKQQVDDKEYAVRLYDIDVFWRVIRSQIHVVRLTRLASP